MPSESKKKKSHHSDKKPVIVVKSEPDDLKSLDHYVDDRVELMKQVFGVLKPKTIQSIAPDFLQKKSTKELQDICLEELLGISKKRLLSIINSTKCPSDTDSTDSEPEEVLGESALQSVAWSHCC